MEHYFEEVTAEYAGGAPLKSWNISKSPPVEDSDDNNSGGFDCNICLESVQDPVVTFCGHLYCWPCIYKWIHFHTISDEKPDHQEPRCPVCKAEVSEKSLIPLYGPGLMTNSSDKKASSVGIVIPQRPQNPRYTASADDIATTRTASNSQPNLSQPAMAGMFGEMVYARMFGNSQTTLYTYPNYSYHLAGRTSQRMRRRMMAVDKSLSRICFFLFCCVMSCLLLF